MASPLPCYKRGNTTPAWFAHFVRPSQKEKWIDVKYMQYLFQTTVNFYNQVSWISLLLSFMSEFAYCPKVIKEGISGFGSCEDCASGRCSVLFCCFLYFFLGCLHRVSFPWFFSIFALDQLSTWHLRLHSPCSPSSPSLHSVLAKPHGQRFPLTQG